MTIEEVRWWGLMPGETLFRCELQREAGRQMLARLVQAAPAASGRATPLGALVE